MTIIRQVASLKDRGRIEGFLRRDPPLHVFAIGDLDDFYWPYTTWYALEEAEILQMVLLYGDPPRIIHALTSEDRTHEMCELLKAIRRLLPRILYGHLTPGVAEGLGDSYEVKRRGLLRKMVLTDDRAAGEDADLGPVSRLGESDAEALAHLYRESSPDTAFDARMLATVQFLGLYQD